jgi:hypothetical protein
MRTWITGGLALSAVFTMMGEGQAYVNYPWCAIGESRGVDCVFASKEQCAQDGRSRGFGGQCMQNPSYRSNLPSVVGQASGQAPVSVARRSSRYHTHRHSSQ